MVHVGERLLWVVPLFLSVVLSSVTTAQAESVCVSGYPMDTYCIDRKRLLDKGLETLVYPFEHTVHCLVDVPDCVASGYEILVPSSSASGRFVRAVRLDSDGNDMLLELAKTVGRCGECYGGGTIREGLKVTVRGDLRSGDDIGDDESVPPRITVTEISEGENCRQVSPPTPDPTRNPTPEPTRQPTPAPIPNPTPDPTHRPTNEPTPEPSPEPTGAPVPDPTPEPTVAPIPNPTHEPTPEPTPEPTGAPVPNPTPEPTLAPVLDPTPQPTVDPVPESTSVPVLEPTEAPIPGSTPAPTPSPVVEPTLEPTPVITQMPSLRPSQISQIEDAETPGPTSGGSMGLTRGGVWSVIAASVFGPFFL